MKLISRQMVVELRERLGRPFTAKDLQDATGAGYGAAYQYLFNMRSVSAAHIVDWTTGPGTPIPVYELGAGENVPRPPKLPNASRLKQMRIRSKWGRSEAAIEATLARKLQARKEAYERDVARLVAGAEKAIRELDYGRKRKSAASLPVSLPPMSIVGQMTAAAREAR